MPRISTTFPFPPSFLNSQAAPRRPYATWSFAHKVACGAVIRWSTETIFTPRAAACATTELSAFALDGLMMIAFAPAEIRVADVGDLLRRLAVAAGDDHLRDLAARERLGLDRADHLLRQPLPTSVLLTPSTHLPADRLRSWLCLRSP